MKLLPDGSRLRIRAIAAHDASLLQAFVRRLSVRSRRFRFFTGMTELPADLLQRLVSQDPRRGLALVALRERSDDAVIIGEARCVPDARGDAEFALAVADEYQRRGLGTRLLRTLIAWASKSRVPRLFGEILADNHAMLALARRLGFRLEANALDRTTVIASIEPSGFGEPRA